ncbi:dehydrogenase E1 component subunit alpha/beta [Bacteriovoracaceae bacterium]|nr:dehydrogenase E1 component subunit alpha/beta [Bacteriovoracaceae bacterium]
MDLRQCLKNIFISRKLDDTEIMMRKQNKAFFQISGAGHEGILTAIGMTLKGGHDYFIPYYRDRALCLALGVTPYEMLCQANGNIGDTASYGRQMPAHWGNRKLNIISKSSCTGTQFLQAVGAAETGRYLGKLQEMGLKDLPAFNKDEIVYVSCGDGTTSQGEFWEGLTTSCVKKLPVMFVVEDNGYAISVPVTEQTPGGSISKALENFPELKIYQVDGSNPLECFEIVKNAENYLRDGNGPVLIHASVTRPYSHSLSDDQKMYRTNAELDAEKETDVIKSFPKTLIEKKLMSENEIEAIRKEAHEEVAVALKKALETDWPEKETYADFMYSTEIDPTSENYDTIAKPEGKADIPIAGAINTVLKEEVKKNSLIRVFGEDVADFSQLEKLDDNDLKGKGGVFKVTSGVQRAGKPDQVFNSPLAEANIIGRAIGMASRGLKPVVEIQFFDYIWTAYMQLKNEMSTMRYRSGGTWKCPMVVRVPIGGYLRGGSMYHSQSGESFFTHIPGIHVVYPSNAEDAFGLLRTAIECDDPVMFFEHKHLYYQGYNRCAYPGEGYKIPFGKANIVKKGNDCTIITWGALVNKSVEAAKIVENETGASVEIIDLRTLSPIDYKTIAASLEKTNRVLVAHEETLTSGLGGEICAQINEKSFEFLDAPVQRIAAKDTHVAYNPDLEEVILPQINDVAEKLRWILSY